MLCNKTLAANGGAKHASLLAEYLQQGKIWVNIWQAEIPHLQPCSLKPMNPKHKQCLAT